MADDKIRAYDRHGEKITIDRSEIGRLYALGGKLATKAEITAHDLEQEYAKASTLEKAAGLATAALPAPAQSYLHATGRVTLPPELAAYRAGASKGFTGGLGSLVEKGIAGIDGGEKAAQAYVARTDAVTEAHPTAAGLGEAAGFAGAAIAGGVGGVAGTAGKVAAPLNAATSALGGMVERGVGRALGNVAARGAVGRAATAAARLGAQGAVEGALLNATQTASDDLLHDKDLAADKLFASAGTGALYGGGAGLFLGGTGSLLKSGVTAAGRGLSSVLRRGEQQAATAVAEEVAAAPKGKPVTLSQASLDAGLKQPTAAESPFAFGPEKRPVQLRPDVGQRGMTAAEEPFSLSRRMTIDPDAGLYGPGPIADAEAVMSPLPIGRNARREAMEAALRGEGEALGMPRLRDEAFEPFGIRAGDRPIRTNGLFDVGMDAEAGIAKRGAGGKFQGALPADDALKLSSAKNVPRDVLLRDGIDATETVAGRSPISIPKPDALPTAPPPGLAAELSTQAGTKGLAYDRAWSSLGSGFGLQSTEFAKRAQRYLPGGTRDVGEVLMRKGILNPQAGLMDAARAGTPAAMLPKLETELETVGKRLGDITGASGGRVSSESILKAIDDIAAPYDASAATRPIGKSLRAYGDVLVDSLGIANGAESIAVQDVLRERKALDLMVFENAPLDPKIATQVKRELRGKLEGLVVDALDEASGKLKGDLAKEYKALKKDYLALNIAKEAAEDSAARSAKAGFLGLKDLAAGNGSILKSLASKAFRERGDAVAATMLYQAAERGSLTKWVQRVDDQIGKASKGLLQPPAKGLLRASERMPESRVLARTALTRISEFQSDPESFVDRATRQAESIASHDQELADALVSRQVQAMSFLSSKVPVSPDPDPLDPHPAPKMTPNEQSELARYAWYAEKPARFFSEVARGKITFEGAETAQALMPRAFADLQARTEEELATQLARGHKLPYRQRQLLGVLLDMATTPSQRPDHARFLQANVSSEAADPTPPPPKRPLRSAPGSHMNALDRLEMGGPGRR